MHNKFNEYVLEEIINDRRINSLTKCWIFTGGRTSAGYGVIYIDKEPYYVHRLIAYVCLGLDLNDNSLFVCHKYDNRTCFNPLHLFIGDNYDNMRDASKKGRANNQNRGITHCCRGHEFTKENTYTKPDGTGRECKICKILHREEYKKIRRKN